VCCRIEKNPQLCYTETVSWQHILVSGFHYHRIQQNKPHSECVDVCPVDSSCPTSSHTTQLCWNEKHCQKRTLVTHLICTRNPMHLLEDHVKPRNSNRVSHETVRELRRNLAKISENQAKLQLSRKLGGCSVVWHWQVHLKY